MRRCVSWLILVMLITAFLPVVVSAEENVSDTIYFHDGSYMTVETISGNMRASGSVTGSKEYTYYNSSNVSQWKAELTGSFTYNGSSSTCTSASVDVTVYDSTWYVISKSASKSGNTATASITMGRSYDGIDTNIPVKLTLTCDADGNFS